MIRILCLLIILSIPLSPASASEQAQLRLHYEPTTAMQRISGTTYILETESMSSGVALHEAEIYFSDEGYGDQRATVEIIIRHRTNPAGKITELEIGYYAYLKDARGVFSQMGEDAEVEFNTEYTWTVIAYPQQSYLYVSVRDEDNDIVIENLLSVTVSQVYRVSMALEFYTTDGFFSDSRWRLPDTLRVDGEEPYSDTSHIGYGLNKNRQGDYCYTALRCGFY